MKQFLFLLLISALFLPARESQAQTPKNQTPVHYQELTKKQIRQLKKDQRKKARELADEEAFKAAIGS